MPNGTWLKVFYHGLLAMIISAQTLFAAPIHPPPGTYHTSWIGNSFSGGGAAGKNGMGSGSDHFAFGYWIQDAISSLAVSPGGTIFLSTKWDEAGRTIGLYKDGIPNQVLVSALNSSAKAWGFNTASGAVCVDGDFFYAGNLGKGLLKFRWQPEDINSAQYLQTAILPELPASLSCRNGKILLGYPDRIELRDETNMQLTATYPVVHLSTVLLAPDSSFWVIAGGQVHHLQADGIETGITLPGIGKPTSLAWAKNGTLIISDNGPAQQILFFDVSGKPKLASTFGIKGGLYSGTPGAVAPQKLFALRGAGMDNNGILYVGMSFGDGPNGNTYLRAFSSAGNFLWKDDASAFIDTFGFEPGSDGTVVYGRTTRWRLDLDQQKPGSEATLTAITLDPLKYPDDLRLKSGLSVYPRLIDGVQLLYGLGQYSGGFAIFAGSPDSDILHQVASPPNRGWAWFVDDDGNIWNGDAPGGRIAYYALQSMTAGRPVYDWQKPRTWPRPADFQKVTRIVYQKNTDSLYIFGFSKGQSDNGAWGTLGFTGRRYDGWLAGKPSVRWTNTDLPSSPGAIQLKALPAKDVSLAGDYLFLGMVKDGVQTYASKVAILNAQTGQYVGTLQAGPEVGGLGGWEDMAGSVQAMRRANGEYLILVEDDLRAKNLLFRWRP